MSERCVRCGYTRLDQDWMMHSAPLYGERESSYHMFVPEKIDRRETRSFACQMDRHAGCDGMTAWTGVESPCQCDCHDVIVSYRDYGPGTCTNCGHPVYYPQFVKPGYEGCTCNNRQLETWAEYDADVLSYWQKKQAEQDAARTAYEGQPLRIQTRGMFWKKRAKNL